MIIYEQIFKKYGLSKTQQEIVKAVGEQKIVLEIGSSTGYMSRAFLDNGCIVDCVEVDKNAAIKLPNDVRKIFNLSIEDDDVYKLLNNDYEFIVMADVIEHLINPEVVLKKLLKITSVNTKLIISLPNIASWIMRKQLFFKGDFEYQDSGILDKTHLHFYTVLTLPKLLSQCGYKVETPIGTITRIPFEGFIGNIPIIGWIFKKLIYQRLVESFKNLSYYHFLVIATKKRE